MIRIKTYKFRIYPTKEQEELINKTFNCCRFVYNYFLSKQKKIENYWYIVEEMVQQGYFEENNWKGEFFNKFEAIKCLVELKRNHSWLKDADSIALQSIIENLDMAYNRYYKKIGRKPKYKSKKNKVKSYTTKSSRNNIEILGRKIKLPKLGMVKIKKTRNLDGKLKRVIISRSASDKYFVSIICEVGIEYLPKNIKKIGIDVGVKEFAVCSNGDRIANPKYFRKLEKRINRYQKDLSRKKLNSKNFIKNKVKLCKLYERVCNQKKDFLQKLSTKLIRENQAIAIEALKIKEMIKNNNFAKAILEVSWAEFRSMLEYKSEWYGRELIIVPSNYPSSQLCSECNYKNKEVKNVSLRQWVCPNCGMQHDRDFNAAKNLENLI